MNPFQYDEEPAFGGAIQLEKDNKVKDNFVLGFRLRRMNEDVAYTST